MIIYDDDGFGKDSTKRIYCKYEKNVLDCPDNCSKCPAGGKKEFLLHTSNQEMWSLIRWANRVLKKYPNDPDVILEKGKAYFKEWYYRAAVENFELALEADPVFGQALFYKARALANMRRFDEALSVLDHLEKLYQSDKASELRTKIQNTLTANDTNGEGSGEDKVCNMLAKGTTIYLKQNYLYDPWSTERGRFLFAYKFNFAQIIIEKFGKHNYDMEIGCSDILDLLRYTFYLMAAKLLVKLDYDYYHKDTIISSVRHMMSSYGIKITQFEDLLQGYYKFVVETIGDTIITEKILKNAICDGGIVAGSYVAPFSALLDAMIRNYHENQDIEIGISLEETLEYVQEIINHGIEERLSQKIQGLYTTFVSNAIQKTYTSKEGIINHIKYLRLYCPDICAYKATVKHISKDIENKFSQNSTGRGLATPKWEEYKLNSRCLALVNEKTSSLISLLFMSLIQDKVSCFYETSNKGYEVLIDGMYQNCKCDDTHQYVESFLNEPEDKVSY